MDVKEFETLLRGYGKAVIREYIGEDHEGRITSAEAYETLVSNFANESPIVKAMKANDTLSLIDDDDSNKMLFYSQVTKCFVTQIGNTLTSGSEQAAIDALLKDGE